MLTAPHLEHEIVEPTIMLTIRILALAFVPVFFSPIAWAASLHQQFLGATVPFDVRDAVLTDAVDIATTLIDAFSPAPVWKYIHPFYENYTNYFQECTEKEIARIINISSTYDLRFRVLTVPDRSAHSRRRVVSFSLWEFNRTAGDRGPFWPLGLAGADNGNCSLQLATNTTRAAHLMKAMDSAQKTYLDDVYDHQVYIHLLATHPMWDGNGFAAAHLRWGMALSANMEMPTTLIVTAAGYPLYRSVAFEDIYNISVDRLDSQDTIWYEVMKYSA
ncbi:hypothetical protein F4819DRAFT_267485 [Hypoxylon fuscum]|nr:hypothetical protein F4819DRAFT_267485 [Hypoxylon fuscum]